MSVMTYDEWAAAYRPLPSPDGGQVWEHDETLLVPLNRVWSLIDGDRFQWVSAGYHIVNKFGYAVTEIPWADEFLEALWSDDVGECDCGELYELASREDHCVEEGLCWEHCTHKANHYTQQRDEVLALTEER